MFIVHEENIDKRVLRTRMALRNAFMELMQEKPFEQLTVLDLADRAMINRATFYAHFDDKYALLDYVLRYKFNEHLATMLSDADHLTRDDLRCLALATLTFLQQFIGHCAPSERNSTLPFEAQIQTYLFEILSDWLHGHDPAGLSIQLMATTISSSIMGASLYYARGKSDLERDDYVDQLMDMLIDGVRLSSML